MHKQYPAWERLPISTVQRGQHLPVLVSNSSHFHPGDSVFDTNIHLWHAICPSLYRYGLVTKKITSEIERVYRLHHRFCSATPLDWLLSRNLKPRKLILRAFSDFPRELAPTKITRHTVLSVLWRRSRFARTLLPDY